MTSPLGRTIRPLSTSDVVALQAIDEAAHGQAWSTRTFSDEIARDDRVHLVAESAGAVIGHAAAWIDGPSCRITNVAVHDEHTGGRHASALLIELLQAVLRRRQVTNLLLEVRPANRRAQRLYGRFGFVPVGIERDFYDRGDPQGNRDAVVMAVVDVCADSWRARLESIEHSLHDEGAAA